MCPYLILNVPRDHNTSLRSIYNFTVFSITSNLFSMQIAIPVTHPLPSPASHKDLYGDKRDVFRLAALGALHSRLTIMCVDSKDLTTSLLVYLFTHSIILSACVASWVPEFFISRDSSSYPLSKQDASSLNFTFLHFSFRSSSKYIVEKNQQYKQQLLSAR